MKWLELQWQWSPPAPIVDAEIVDVAPHLAMFASFAVHKKPWAESRKWRMTNIETGRCIGDADAGTKERCIKLAILSLSSRSVSDVLKAYSQHQSTLK